MKKSGYVDFAALKQRNCSPPVWAASELGEH